MKAYHVHDKDGEHHQVIFAPTPGRAKQVSEALDWNDWTYIEARRVPEFDKFADTEIVPDEALIKAGRWLKCPTCYKTVTEENVSYVFDTPSRMDEYPSYTTIAEGLLAVASALIANAPTDLAACVQEIETLRKQSEELHANNGKWFAECQKLREALNKMSRMSENDVEPGYTETDELIAEGFAQGVKWMASIARQALEGGNTNVRD